MALNKYKLGQLIKVIDERNNYGIRAFYGIILTKNLCLLLLIQRDLMKVITKLFEKTDLYLVVCKQVEMNVSE